MNLLNIKWGFGFMLIFGSVVLTAFFILILFTNLPEKTLAYISNQVKGINSQNFAASLLQESDETDNISGEPENLEEQVEEITLASSETNFGVARPTFAEASAGRQDLLDDIQEKLDIIQQQVFLLEKQQKQESDILTEEENVEEEKLEDESAFVEDFGVAKEDFCVGQVNINTASLQELDRLVDVGPTTAEKIVQARPFYLLNDLLKVSGIGEATLLKIIQQGCAYVDPNIGPAPVYGGGGGGNSPPVYSKILISEIQTGNSSDEKQEFVELYNSNNFVIDLTNWYLQRKTSNSSGWATYAPANLFSGKTIASKSYFVVSREGYYSGSNDVFTDNPITTDNSFALKNPNGEISDKVGFGNAIDFETLPTLNPDEMKNQSIGRVWDEANQTYFDTENNSIDFEINTPTPKSKNVKWQEPEPPKPVETKNILINEIQISGLTEEKEEFVELYNPNDFNIDLSGYILQRKTKGGSTSSYVTESLFFGKTISSNDYFLIAREGSLLAGIADIKTSQSLGDYSNSGGSTLILKKARATEVFDKVGFGAVSDFEGNNPAPNPLRGESISRMNRVDTNDNSADFVVLDVPTPKN